MGTSSSTKRKLSFSSTFEECYHTFVHHLNEESKADDRGSFGRVVVMHKNNKELFKFQEQNTKQTMTSLLFEFVMQHVAAKRGVAPVPKVFVSVCGAHTGRAPYSGIQQERLFGTPADVLIHRMFDFVTYSGPLCDGTEYEDAAHDVRWRTAPAFHALFQVPDDNWNDIRLTTAGASMFASLRSSIATLHEEMAHMDLHMGNVWVNHDSITPMRSSDKLRVSIIDFGMAVPLNGPSEKDHASATVHGSLTEDHAAAWIRDQNDTATFVLSTIRYALESMSYVVMLPAPTHLKTQVWARMYCVILCMMGVTWPSGRPTKNSHHQRILDILKDISPPARPISSPAIAVAQRKLETLRRSIHSSRTGTRRAWIERTLSPPAEHPSPTTSRQSVPFVPTCTVQHTKGKNSSPIVRRLLVFLQMHGLGWKQRRVDNGCTVTRVKSKHRMS